MSSSKVAWVRIVVNNDYLLFKLRNYGVKFLRIWYLHNCIINNIVYERFDFCPNSSNFCPFSTEIDFLSNQSDQDRLGPTNYPGRGPRHHNYFHKKILEIFNGLSKFQLNKKKCHKVNNEYIVRHHAEFHLKMSPVLVCRRGNLTTLVLLSLIMRLSPESR